MTYIFCCQFFKTYVPSSLIYIFFVSQLILYVRTCSTYEEFLIWSNLSESVDKTGLSAISIEEIFSCVLWSIQRTLSVNTILHWVVINHPNCLRSLLFSGLRQRTRLVWPVNKECSFLRGTWSYLCFLRFFFFKEVRVYSSPVFFFFSFRLFRFWTLFVITTCDVYR